MPFKLIFTICLIAFGLSADPFGKDADLVNPPRPKMDNSAKSIPEAMIRFHQVVVSPADGPRSHFIPSSSQYTLDAMRKYGFFKGFLLGCDRLQRENKEAWVYRTTLDGAGNEFKFDPVR